MNNRERERSPIYQTRATRVLHFDDLRRPRRRGRLAGIVLGLLALIAVGALIGQGLRAAAHPDDGPAPGARPAAPRERVVTELAEAAGASPAATEAPAAQPAAFLTVTGTEGQGLRLRPEPGLVGVPTAVLAEGSAVEPTGEAATADGLTWVEVRAADGLRGWAATDYLR